MTYLMEVGIPTLAAALLYMTIGAVWYSKSVFGTLWMQLEFEGRRTKEDLKKQMPVALVGSFIMALITACILRKVLLIFGVTNAVDGMQYGLWLSLGFVASIQLTNALYAGKSLKLYGISAGYHVVSIIAMSALFGIWH